jgi:hypothetical protein
VGSRGTGQGRRGRRGRARPPARTPWGARRRGTAPAAAADRRRPPRARDPLPAGHLSPRRTGSEPPLPLAAAAPPAAAPRRAPLALLLLVVVASLSLAPTRPAAPSLLVVPLLVGSLLVVSGAGGGARAAAGRVPRPRPSAPARGGLAMPRWGWREGSLRVPGRVLSDHERVGGAKSRVLTSKPELDRRPALCLAPARPVPTFTRFFRQSTHLQPWRAPWAASRAAGRARRASRPHDRPGGARAARGPARTARLLPRMPSDRPPPAAHPQDACRGGRSAAAACAAPRRARGAAAAAAGAPARRGASSGPGWSRCCCGATAGPASGAGARLAPRGSSSDVAPAPSHRPRSGPRPRPRPRPQPGAWGQQQRAHGAAPRAAADAAAAVRALSRGWAAASTRRPAAARPLLACAMRPAARAPRPHSVSSPSDPLTPLLQGMPDPSDFAMAEADFGFDDEMTPGDIKVLAGGEGGCWVLGRGWGGVGMELAARGTGRLPRLEPAAAAAARFRPPPPRGAAGLAVRPRAWPRRAPHTLTPLCPPLPLPPTTPAP